MSIRSEWAEMIKEGLLVPTGEMRRNSKGDLEPVYVLSDNAKAQYAKIFAHLVGSEGERDMRRSRRHRSRRRHWCW